MVISSIDDNLKKGIRLESGTVPATVSLGSSKMESTFDNYKSLFVFDEWEGNRRRDKSGDLPTEMEFGIKRKYI